MLNYCCYIYGKNPVHSKIVHAFLVSKTSDFVITNN